MGNRPRTVRHLHERGTKAEIRKRPIATRIVAVLALNAGPGEVGLLATAQTLPFLLLSIPHGLWADRTSRLRVFPVRLHVAGRRDPGVATAPATTFADGDRVIHAAQAYITRAQCRPAALRPSKPRPF